MKILETLTPSAARSCGRAAKSLRIGSDMREGRVCRVAKGQNRKPHGLERLMDRRSSTLACLGMALVADCREVTI